ncbi:MAG: hypothetical protein DHS80DRAFT_1804, partial [Piptocephalis tieghemiana]
KGPGMRRPKPIPLVLPALQRHPPTPLPPRATIPTSSLAAPHEWEMVNPRTSGRTSRNHAKNRIRPPSPRPQVIAYPEDKWRRRFYKEHPLELRRIQTLEESE